MVFIVWDRQKQQFYFRNCYRLSIGKKIYFKVLIQKNSNLRGQPYIERKSCNFNHLCLISVQKIFTAFELFCKAMFRGWPRNSLMGPLSKKKKMKVNIVEIIIFSHFCSIRLFNIFYVSEMSFKDLTVWLLISLTT